MRHNSLEILLSEAQILSYMSLRCSCKDLYFRAFNVYVSLVSHRFFFLSYFYLYLLFLCPLTDIIVFLPPVYFIICKFYILFYCRVRYGQSASQVNRTTKQVKTQTNIKKSRSRF